MILLNVLVIRVALILRYKWVDVTNDSELEDAAQNIDKGNYFISARDSYHKNFISTSVYNF